MSLSNHLSDSTKITLKGLLVCVLIMLMLIPGCFVADLVTERQQRQTEVIHEISGKWANAQTVTGPVLMLPYRHTINHKDGTTTSETKMAYILPDDLKINGNIVPKEKKRSLYNVKLYHADVQLSGKFKKLPLSTLRINPESVMWEDAKLVINVQDVRGIDEQVVLNWNGAKQEMEAGVPVNKVFTEGISTPVSINATDQYSFSVGLSVRGSEQLFFSPLGKTTETDIQAKWKDPSFDGKFLPTTSDIGDDKFTAHWKILPLAHQYPQYWKDNSQDLTKSAYGVRLIQSVNDYTQTDRSVKYSLLFVALTFGFFFFLEILQKKRIHPIQYLLVGIALTIFYTLLLSISEYAGFSIAYLIAATATILLIGLYVRSIFNSTKTAAGFTAVLSSLYGYIYIIIQSEDYALLFGSIGLFGIVATIMHFSKKVTWYGPAKEDVNFDPGTTI